MALRLFAAEQADCGEVARIFMVRVEALLAAAHAGVVGDVPESDEYQREILAYVMAFGGVLQAVAEAAFGRGRRGRARRGERAARPWNGGRWVVRQRRALQPRIRRRLGRGVVWRRRAPQSRVRRRRGSWAVGKRADRSPVGGRIRRRGGLDRWRVAGQRRRQRERRKGRSFASGSVLCLLAARALPLLPGARLLRPCARVGFRKGSLPGAVSGGRVHA